jgi:hypothetical protein
LKERKKGREDEGKEEGISSYWMTVQKREDPENCKKKY